MGAAEDAVASLDAVTDHVAAAMLTRRSEGVDRAPETVEDVRLTLSDNLERLVVVVAADLKDRHRYAGPEEFGFEISSSTPPAFFSFASIATSAWARMPTSCPSSTTGSLRT